MTQTQKWSIDLQNLKVADSGVRASRASGHRADASQEALVVQVSAEGGELVLTGDPGHVGGGDWATATHIVLDVYHQNDEVLPVRLAFRKHAEREDALVALMGVLPHVATRLCFPLEALASERVFLPRTPGKLKTVVQGPGLKPSEVARFSIGTTGSVSPRSFTLRAMYLTDSEPEYPISPVVLVDELGQYRFKEWTGKTENDEVMVRRLREERDDEGATPSPFHADRSDYGGWKSKRFDGTGFFRTEHDGRRWWLVDPTGCAFISAGVDCVIPGETARVTGIEALAAWLPPKAGVYADAWEVHNTEDPLHGGDYFNYPIANLIRAFGDDWRKAWTGMTKRRLLNWGFNTVANWSSSEFISDAQLPYVWQPNGFPDTKNHIFRDFPDVFSEEYRSAADAFALQLSAVRDNPLLIGYFLRNEPLWAFAGEVNLAEKLLNRPEPLESKDALLQFLHERYSGDVRVFNDAWQCELSSIDDLKQYCHRPFLLGDIARIDLMDFTRKMIEAYVAIPSLACRKVDPNHLNLGMRYAWISTENLFAGSEHFDVFSMNSYQLKPRASDVELVASKTGLPIMIGEFHFGAMDAGLLSNSLRGVTSQSERGKAYQYYVEQAVAMPQVIGTHYFSLNDQPLLGRFDGENFQMGIVDVCHRPYDEFVKGIEATHRRLYSVATGELSPSEEVPNEVPRIGF